MRYTPKQYAKALHETLQHKHGDVFSEIVKKFLRILKQSKTTKLLPKILREVERLESGNVVEVAGAKALPHNVTARLQETFAADRIKEKTMPELLGGMVVEWDDWRVDGSVARRLRELQICQTRLSKK
jgi:F0F1-type ATP synthase delta subunit